MGLFDGMDLSSLDPELRKLLQQGQATDTKAPLNAGLMAAGLGMLMNAHKGAAGGIGAGGLLGLDAYNAERVRQQKDPMAQINLLNGVMGLNNTLMQNREMKRVAGMFDPQGAPQQFAPAPGLPPDVREQAYGMFDRSNGDGGQLGAMQAPTAATQNRPNPQMVMSMIASPVASISAMGEKLYKALGYEPQNMRPGGSVVMPDAQGNLSAAYTAPNIGEGQQILPGGAAALVPGYLQNTAAIKAAMSGAEVAGRLPFTTTDVPSGDPMKPSVPMTGEQYLAMVRSRGAPQGQQGGADAKPDAGTIQAMNLLKKQGIPTSWQPQTGLLVGNDAVSYQAQQRDPEFGLKPSGPASAQAQQQALMPGELNKAFGTDLNTYQVKNFADGHKVAEAAAYEALPAIKEVRAKIAAGAFTGGGAETKTAILNTVNGWFGTDIKSEKVAQSMALNSALGVQLLANAKKLGYNPTDADANRIDNIVGKQGLSAGALAEIANMQEKWARQAISRHNSRVDNIEASYKDRGLPAPDFVGLRVTVPREGKGGDNKAVAQSNIEQQLEAEMRKRGLLK